MKAEASPDPPLTKTKTKCIVSHMSNTKRKHTKKKAKRQ